MLNVLTKRETHGVKNYRFIFPRTIIWLSIRFYIRTYTIQIVNMQKPHLQESHKIKENAASKN